MYRSEAASPDKLRTSGLNNSTTISARTDQPLGTTPSNMPSRRSIKRGESLIEEGSTQQYEQERKQMATNNLEQNEDITQRTSLAHGLVASLLENTGAHGIPNIKRAPNLFRRLMWTGLFLLGLAMFLWQTSWLLERYYSYGVDVKLDISNDRMIAFPAVTICNLNGIRSEYIEDLVDGGWSLPPSLNRPTLGLPSVDPDTEEDEQFSKIADAVKLVGLLNYHKRPPTGHLLSDMLLRCVFQGRACHARDFTHFHHYLYGNCYIFNAETEPTQRRFVSKPGPLHGLTVEMYIEQDQYMENIQPSAGARVAVHPQNEMPFPEDEGTSVSPGHETFIGVKRTNYTRLEHPYSNCTLDNDRNKETIFNLALPYIHYSQRACENDCFYQNFTQECGCTNAKYRYDDSIPLCVDATQDACLDRIEELYLDGDLDCNCTSPCRELGYDVTVGQARWPNEKFKPFLYTSVRNFSEDLERDIDGESDPDFLEKNVLKINVYFDKLEYTTIYQEKAYDEIALLSDMGGNVGLWIGVSVLTVFEFIELAYDLCKLIAYRIAGGQMGPRGAMSTSKVTASEIDLEVRNNGTIDEEHSHYENS
ncbi:amiloride-sensitive sodium channel subunit gamma-2-like isoform X2 [Asterias rubens]|uniref:amiloride-sensitive sodium channel subunit gamma-2-like isoform X2 n=1 Tax=Asterias rubens TaxID=7604 RepID=UPI0014551FC0|nr:amiloride-sensitive sodium channel subunit gamma-2-like isoform X2 [Asterias rubens]